MVSYFKEGFEYLAVQGGTDTTKGKYYLGVIDPDDGRVSYKDDVGDLCGFHAGYFDVNSGRKPFESFSLEGTWVKRTCRSYQKHVQGEWYPFSEIIVGIYSINGYDWKDVRPEKPVTVDPIVAKLEIELENIKAELRRLGEET